MEFQNEDTNTTIEMRIAAGHEELNEFYRAAAMVYVQPHALGLHAGKISEERQLEIQMQAYACGVVLETDPKMTEAEIFEWFQGHPKEFAILFEIADCRENFEEDGNSNEPGAPRAPVEQGGKGAW
jgi:hypothetical protein